MKPRASLPISLAVAAILAACGGSSSDPVSDPCENGACGRDASSDAGGSSDSGGSPDARADANARVCTPRCRTNLDCASTCPTSPLYCCDAAVGTCYGTASGSCPAVLVDSGTIDSALPYGP